MRWTPLATSVVCTQNVRHVLTKAIKLHIFSLVILFLAQTMKRITGVSKCTSFLLNRRLGFLYRGANLSKAPVLAWTRPTALWRPSARKRVLWCKAILVLVFIHLSAIYRETAGFMAQSPIVCTSGHLFWSALSLVHWPLAEWAWPGLDLGLLHLLIPLPVCNLYWINDESGVIFRENVSYC